jgi:acetate kinase
MRDLESAAAGGDQKAQLAIQIFCASIRKVIAAYASVLDGLDMLIFSGGIGEHSAPVRKNVCDGLGFLGISIDDAANRSNASEISATASKVRVRIVPTQEDRQIARHSRTLLRKNTRDAD